MSRTTHASDSAASATRALLPLVPVGLLAALGAVLAYAWKAPCRFGGAWNDGTQQFLRFCYTDIYPLWWNEKLDQGLAPYFGHPVEYPVGIGGIMWVIQKLVWGLNEPGVWFFDITALVMAASLVAGVVIMVYLAGAQRRPWDAVWYALAPALILTAFINWDLLCGALSLGAFLAWARGRHVLTGVLLGLAVATKFYPLVFFGPLLLLALRTRKLNAFLWAAGGAVVTWVVVNLPFMLLAFEGWKRFYVFSSERGADWGSVWFFFQREQVPFLGDGERLDMLGIASFAVLCLGVAVLALAAPTRPRLMQLAFLVLAAFMVTNKVWSPQYVLWLVPFAVLARPNWKPLALWQVAECWYFFAIWLYLVAQQPGNEAFGIGDVTYYTAIWGRVVTIAIMAAFVVRDILRPEHDVIRQGGADDPTGGVFDGAPDRFVLRAPAAPQPAPDSA
ncbi:membrane protein [Sphaerisporangium krabiense]|uniref:Putative membrane protein n=1 Tax=Sphaerisporangium krabiense TaxID=763782 RepID=A0A7W9DPI0_9ACTN|nr:glycosyltransferase 87 family protein [Sphaerisporangium krabiense]MBB5626408.1 putative membrane protein [Sphaerisporangium krabiense]GII63325.1 membrane protein [Sphaerisporangium krabiense]